MIALLLRMDLSERAAKLFCWIVVPLLIVILFYLALHAYGDARYRDGRAVEEKLWKDASDRLIEQAAQVSRDAETEAVARALDHAAAVEDEKEKLDAAVKNGDSPFDVLFPRGVSSAGTGEDNPVAP